VIEENETSAGRSLVNGGNVFWHKPSKSSFNHIVKQKTDWK